MIFVGFEFWESFETLGCLPEAEKQLVFGFWLIGQAIGSLVVGHHQALDTQKKLFKSADDCTFWCLAHSTFSL